MDFYPAVIALSAAVFAALVIWGAARHVRAAKSSIKRAEQQRLDQLLNRLASGLAHELKNPLGALSLNLQLLEEELLEEGRLKESSKARLATIKKDYHRFEEVLNNFLRYASRRQVNLAPENINVIVRDLVTFLRPEMARAGLEVATAFHEEPIICQVDAPLMKQALLNIMLNAIEAASPGKSLRVSTSRTDSHALVTIEDTGSGIDAADVPHVFDEYFSKKKDGTGLGLSITKRIVEDHDGRIDISSAPGEGTVVRVELRLSEAAPQGAQ